MSSRKQSKPAPPASLFKRWWPALVVWVLAMLVWWSRTTDHSLSTSAPPGQSAASPASGTPYQPPEPEAEVFARYAGSANCTECHSAQHHHWLESNHALAERLPTNTLDRAAFDPTRTFSHGQQTSTAKLVNGQPTVQTRGFGGVETNYPVVRVIGHDPLRQFLVDGGNGRLQTLEASYDPHRNEWFNVYGDEDRQPGEWGHWTGRGMNWNAMCATCHNTRLRKNYDPRTDSYHTAMAERTVSCESCHGPMKEHVLAYRSGTVPAQPATLTREQILHTCAGCHSRRAELTGDFQPGENYFDHHQLTVPDLSETYYADGQVRGENYVFGSFLGSKMHAAGVHCLDCHEPHTTKLILPGNDLCMRCHSGGYPNSPKIEPEAHSFHAVDSAGNQCVNCHMPQTTYMQRHARRDHGFTIPDPLLTKQYGVPNACNRCHTDKDTDWALASVEQRYGEKMNRGTRTRAQTIARARAGDQSAKADVLRLLTGDDTAYWKAVAANLTDQWLGETDVRAALVGSLVNTNELLRAHAAQALEPLAQAHHPDAESALQKLLDDPVRSVRVNAAWALRGEVDPNSRAGRELEDYLQLNADQPTGQLQLGTLRLAQRDNAAALGHFLKSVEWDPNSAPFHHELAVLYSMMNQPDRARRQLEEAVRLAPNEAEYHYKLALAWNESGDLGQTVSALEKAVQVDPRHARAWYNLGLARNETGDAARAIEALFRAESADARDPRIPYARATIHTQLGDYASARSAAGRALELEPGYGEARQLLNSLSGR